MLVAVFAFLVLPVAAAVLSETYYFEVEKDDVRALDVALDVALGKVFIGKAERGYHFQAEVEMESEAYKPEFEYDGRGRRGRIAIGMEQQDREGVSFRSVSDAVKNSTWKLRLGESVPVNLAIDMGMANGDFDFTGIPIEEFTLDTGISTTSVDFPQRNPVPMSRLTIDAGASKFYGHQLGNARFDRFVFDGGAGKFYLDFTGRALEPGSRADVDLGMADIEIVVPDHLPVIIRAPDSWTCKVRVPDGFIKERDGVYRTPDARDREAAFYLVVEAGIGRVNFVTPAEAELDR